MWFNNVTDQWTIGSSVGSGGGFFSPSGFECPNEVGSQWTYHVVGSANTVLDAGNDVSVKCQGKEYLLIRYNVTFNFYTLKPLKVERQTSVKPTHLKLHPVLNST